LQPSFDAHAFAGKRIYAVSPSTGLSFDDYSRMSTHSHKQRAERKLAAPFWARNDEALRNLLVRFMETRALFKYPRPGTLTERLRRAVSWRRKGRRILEKTLRNLTKEYVACPRRKWARKRRLAVEIQNVDSTLCLIARNEPALIARVVYLYFRAEMNSVGVAAETGIKPPAVRVILWKLDQLWKKEFENPGPPVLLCGSCKRSKAQGGLTRCGKCATKNRVKGKRYRRRKRAQLKRVVKSSRISKAA
jgi:hypothetical protein